MSSKCKRDPRGRLNVGLASVGVAVGLCLSLVDDAAAQQAQSLSGPPVQVIPYASEPGVPAIVINPGTPNPFPTGGGTGTGGTGGGNTGDSSALSTLLGTSWGAQAVQNADALGINPSALAATCVVESGCQNLPGSGSVAGAFQMTASTYTAMINAAIAQNPSLAGTIVPGLAGQMDPATESIAASEYLLQGAQYLQSQGITNPTVLDVRGYYNFGPQGGAQIASASPNQTMASVLTGYSAATLAANGITPGETVAQWQASVSAKIGNAASQSVLNG